MGRDFEFLEAARIGDLLYFEKFFANKKTKALQRYSYWIPVGKIPVLHKFSLPITSPVCVVDPHQTLRTRAVTVPFIMPLSMVTCE